MKNRENIIINRELGENKLKTSILFSEDQIQKKIQEMAQEINQAYGKDKLLAIGILKGAFVFYTELLTHLEQDLTCDFCAVSFYGPATKAASEASLSLDVKSSIEGENILLIDCIADRGRSIDFLKKHLSQRKPASIKTAVLITKPYATKNSQIDFKGFTVDQDVFVVGYGIDYKDQGRNLNYFAQINDFN